MNRAGCQPGRQKRVGVCLSEGHHIAVPGEPAVGLEDQQLRRVLVLGGRLDLNAEAGVAVEGPRLSRC